ncbi:hypothetical protein K0040_13850 [Terrisporobacter petrolearius]|uniref:hypothetical protein n=1 Tax=Terrisporobacter petrolearius TaxID=1460447 RepID=UPI001D16104E|nr:hypothetical protein [Terrisporobacter petrolearius]MCC3865352.1 hypothetical protein [Terrisporobacter petrolearius]
MREKLLNIIYEFGEKLTQEEYNQYIPKLRDYLVPYIIENKNNSIDIGDIFRDEFTKSDIINATIYYVTNNENVKSLSSIDDYLVSINRLFDELLFNKYPNSNLMKYKPFTSLNSEIQNILINKGIELKKKETHPAINLEQYKFIIKYLKDIQHTKRDKSVDIKQNQVSIIIKLFLLYGFSLNKLANIRSSDYLSEKRILRIDYKGVMENSIYIELPYSLAQEIDDYLERKKDFKNLNCELLFVTGDNNKITSSFMNDILKSIKMDYLEINKDKLYKDPFTARGLQKYAIIQMIKQRMSQYVIMEFTGQKNKIYEDCQNEVNRTEDLNRNRYVNHIIRGISTYDEI